VLIGSVLAALGAALGVGLLGLVLPLVRGAPDLRDSTVVPLVAALVAIATLLSSPVNNGLSRLIETRADVASLKATRDPVTFAKMQRELDLRSLSDNGPAWSQFWFGSHPTTLERIAIAEQLGRRMGITPDPLLPPK
jgi:STE24 endopeptidase